MNGSDNLKGKNLEDLTEEERENLISPERWEIIRKIKGLEDDSKEMEDHQSFLNFIKENLDYDDLLLILFNNTILYQHYFDFED